MPYPQTNNYASVGNQAGGNININNFAATTSIDEIIRKFKRDGLDYTESKHRIPTPIEGTCEWVKKCSKYEQWIRQPCGIFLVVADPGCGKSVLARAMVDDFQRVQERENALVCYFFFESNVGIQRSSTMAFGALIHQVLSKNRDIARASLENMVVDGDNLNEDIQPFWDLLMKILQSSRKQVICVLDALDNCEDGEELLEYLIKNCPSSTLSASRIKFFLTSRPFGKLAMLIDKPDNPPEFSVVKDNDANNKERIREEISRVIQKRVPEVAAFRDLTPSEVSALISDLQRKNGDATYLWVDLVLKELQRKENQQLTKKAWLNLARTFPRSLDLVYAKMLSEVNDVAYARRLMHILIAARRPLTWQEANIAVELRCNFASDEPWDAEETENSERAFRTRLLACCGFFMTISSGKVHFIHQTARDFLLKTARSPEPYMLWKWASIAYDCLASAILRRPRSWKNSISVEIAERALAETCTKTLLLKSSTDEDRLLSFIRYSAVYWESHYRYPGASTDTLTSFAGKLCKATGKQGRDWLLAYCQHHHLHERPQSGLVLASYLGLSRVVRKLLEEEDLRFGDYDMAMQTACSRSHVGVIDTLLDRRPEQFEVSLEVSMAAARNGKSGEQVMRRLFTRCGRQVPVTTEVLVAAAGNWDGGEQLIELLCNKTEKITINSEVLMAAAANRKTGERVLLCLKKRFRPLDLSELKNLITPEVVVAAARNWDRGKVMGLLLNWNQDIIVTRAILVAAAENWGSGAQLMKVLLGHPKQQHISIPREVVIAAAGNKGCGKSVMELLLEHDKALKITPEVVVTAAGNWGNGEQVIELLLGRISSGVLTPRVVVAAAGNWASGEEVLRLLLAKYAHSVPITNEVIAAAAGNWGSGKQVMELLIQTCGQQIRIPPEAVVAAAGSWDNGEQVLMLLLQECASIIPITCGALIAAARNWKSGEQVMKLLLNQVPGDLPTTPEVLVAAAAGNWGSGVRVIEFLLAQLGPNITITRRAVTAAVRNKGSGKEVLKLFLDRHEQGLQISADLVTDIEQHL